MKNIFETLIGLKILALALMLNTLGLSAQEQAGANQNQSYAKVIKNISEWSQGKITGARVLEIIALPVVQKKLPMNPNRLLGDTIFIVPEIAVAAYDQNQISFQYFPEDTFFEDSILISFPQNPGWITGSTVDSTSSEIAVNIQTNALPEPRSTPVRIQGIINTDTVEYTAYILQQAQQQQFILVLPQFLTLSPEAALTIPIDITTINVDGWTAIFTTNWISVDSASLTNQSIRFDVAANNGNSSRTATIEIQDIENPDIAAQITLTQEASFLVLDPAQVLVPCEGANILVNISSLNVDSIVVDAGVFFGTVQIFSNDSLALTIPPNPDATARQASISVCSFDNPAICAELDVLQYSCNQAYIVISPAFHSVPYEGGLSPDYFINTSNVPTWEVIFDNAIPWITDTIFDGGNLRFQVAANSDAASRSATFKVRSTSNGAIVDSAVLFQAGAPMPVILASPRTQVVSHQGSDSVDFIITYQNIDSWTLDNATLPPWITVDAAAGNLLSLDVMSNNSNITRNANIRIFSPATPQVRDSVFVVQYAAPEQDLVAAPRQQSLPWTASPSVAFAVTAVNVDHWLVDTTALPAWINVAVSGDEVLMLDVEANLSASTRQAVISIFDSLQTEVRDSVSIYQFAQTEAYLIASPREKRLSRLGAEKTDFVISRANVENWETDVTTLPLWIEVLNEGNDTLSLKITENPSMQTRSASISIFATEDTTVRDSVFVFQYAANDTVLIAAPREVLLPAEGSPAVDFAITALYVDAWRVDEDMLADWIEVVSTSEDSLRISVSANDSPGTRSAMIQIYDTLNRNISDSLFIYQYATPQAYILISPRSDTSGFTGKTTSFDITTVNISGDLFFDEALLPEWIEAEIVNNLLNVEINPNGNSATRETTIVVYEDNNPDIRDSVLVYQYALPGKYLLAAPREQSVGHEPGTALFDITAVGMDTWFVDTTTLPAWIPEYSMIGQSIMFSYQENLSLQTRSASIRIFADSMASPVEDYVSIYQYSKLDYYLLAAPREQNTGPDADTLYFVVDTINVSSWQAQIPGDDSSWIEILISGADTLALAIAENSETTTRQGSIALFSAVHPDAHDQVSVYQYSASEPYIALDRTFEVVPYSGDTIQVTLYSNVDSISISKGNQSPWYEILGGNIISPVNNTYTFGLKISQNPEAYLARSAFLEINALNLPDTLVSENFYFRQLINPNLNNILLSGFITTDSVGLPAVDVIVGEDTVYSAQSGYFQRSLPYGWVGAVTPLKADYYFEPPNYVFETSQKADNDTVNFNAFLINPTIAFNIENDTISICPGAAINRNSPEYPSFDISGTFGARSYWWFSNPPDPQLNTDTTETPAWQVFSPTVTTRYSLVLYNYGTADTSTFTLGVYPLPEARIISGPDKVCKNQAGLIYSVSEFLPGETFSWELWKDSLLLNTWQSNIAVIDFGSDAGSYELVLKTFNKYGCSSSRSMQIEMANTEAPPATTVNKKSGDNMLVCTDTDATRYHYSWGWYTINDAGMLDEAHIIPDRKDWFCRLPENHTFDPIKYKYFVQMTFADDSSCASLSFLNGNAPVKIDEANSQPFTVFPNPSSGQLYLRFAADFGGMSVRTILLNSAGQRIFSRVFDRGVSGQVLLIDNSDILEPGIYLLRTEIAGTFYNTKIVVQ